ncbi:MAG: hypothetical protein WCR01_02835 [Bacteroidota bacterium]
MKKFTLLVVSFVLICMVTATAQEKPGKQKNDQVNLWNDFYISYGIGSVLYFSNQNSDYNKTTTGTFLIGYSRSINRVIAVGFQVSYGNVERTTPTNLSDSWYKYNDNYWQGMAGVRFRYLNKPMFCMYSGVGIGVTMDYYSESSLSYTKTGQKLLPAAQLTLLGFRVGRAISFFGEFGIGTNSIINAGVSYKFGE